MMLVKLSQVNIWGKRSYKRKNLFRKKSSLRNENTLALKKHLDFNKHSIVKNDKICNFRQTKDFLRRLVKKNVLKWKEYFSRVNKPKFMFFKSTSCIVIEESKLYSCSFFNYWFVISLFFKIKYLLNCRTYPNAWRFMKMTLRYSICKL